MWPSPRTNRSEAEPKRSPTPGSAQQSSTDSHSTAPSSRPAPSPTASPRPRLGSSRRRSSPEANWPVVSNLRCLGPGGPGTQSAVFPNVQVSPVVRQEAKRGHRPGPAFAERAPCCRSRSGNWNTRRVRCTARTWRTRADGIGTGTSRRAFCRRHRPDGPRQRPCPRSRPCTSAAARPVLFKSSCPAFSPTTSRPAQPSRRRWGRSRPKAGATSSRNNWRTSPEVGPARAGKAAPVQTVGANSPPLYLNVANRGDGGPSPATPCLRCDQCGRRPADPG